MKKRGKVKGGTNQPPKTSADLITGTWATRDDLTQSPNGPDRPYVSIVEYKSSDPLTGKQYRSFAAIFDCVQEEGSNNSKNRSGFYNGEEYFYKDDHIAVYQDTNNSGKLEVSDKFLGSFFTGHDWGGLNNERSSGTFTLDKNNTIATYDSLGSLMGKQFIPFQLIRE
mgnify:CR=1 FL=1